ncbi:hypothetical protein Hanom_Chr02g00145911 [Helianthus anomalus]
MGGVVGNQVDPGLGSGGLNAFESDKVDESPFVEAERPKEFQESPRHVHAEDQREKVGGGEGSIGGEDLFNKCVDQDFSFSLAGGPSSSRLGDLGPGAPLGFNVGKANYFTAKKGRSLFSKGGRSSNRSGGPEPMGESFRPRKRPRSCLEDKYANGTSTSEEMSSKNPATAFEQFFFDLNNAAPSEIPVANRVEDISQQVSGEPGAKEFGAGWNC